MTKDTKITKKMILAGVKFAAENGADFGDVTAADVIEFADNTIAQLEAKAAKAKETAAKKRAEGDALREQVETLLTDEFQTIAEIAAQIDDPEVTNAKVSNRLSALVKLNLAHKAKVDVDGRKLNGYAAGPAPADAE